MGELCSNLSITRVPSKLPRFYDSSMPAWSFRSHQPAQDAITLFSSFEAISISSGGYPNENKSGTMVGEQNPFVLMQYPVLGMQCFDILLDTSYSVGTEAKDTPRRREANSFWCDVLHEYRNFGATVSSPNWSTFRHDSSTAYPGNPSYYLALFHIFAVCF